MPLDSSTPYFRKETLADAVQVVDERESQSTLLQLFPRRLKGGDTITVRTLTRTAQDIRQTTRDGKGYTIDKGTATETQYRPGWVKPQAEVNGDDLDVFYAATQAVGQQDDRSAAIVDDANQRVMSLAERLMTDDAAWRKKAIIGALTGSYSFYVDDTAQTITYGLTSIASPSTTWTNAAATILTDFRTALNTFYEVAGVEADTVFHSPKLTDDIFKNTQMNTLLGGSPQLSEALLSLSAGSLGGGPLGTMMGLGAGVQWIPVQGRVVPVGGGAATDIWPRTKIVLANRALMGAEWGMAFSALYGITTAAPNVEMSTPPEGSDVKSIKVTLFDNGIATFRRPDLVMPWTVEF